MRYSWGDDVGEEVYLPYLQATDYLERMEAHYSYMTIVMRGRDDAVGALVAPARAAILSRDRSAAVSDVTTMDEAVARALARPRFQSTLLALCAGVALMLAAAGIYGVMSYAVTRRTREIGLRLALGAPPEQVRRMVLSQSLRRVVLGVIAGLAGAAALTQLMAGLLYGVRPGDPVTFAAAVIVLAVVALLASAIPAWRASRIDPMTALRQD